MDWKCSGCGKPAPERIATCDCPTDCVYADSDSKQYGVKRDVDRERFGGPITDAMLHTALRTCAHHKPTNPRDAFDLARLAKIINGWLVPVAN